MVNSKELTTIKPLPKDLERWLNCQLFHSRIPKYTSEGIKWVCKEGCNNHVGNTTDP